MDNSVKKFQIISKVYDPVVTDLPRVYKDYRVVDHGRGSNWIHPSLIVIQVESCGLGVITKDFIPENTLLLVYGGKVISASEFEQLPKDLQHFPYQIGATLFLCPADIYDIGVGERVNHSCNPNAGFQGAIHLVAMRDISVGEEITIDYATCVSANEDAFIMQCLCNSTNCRGGITGQDWQLKDVQSRLLPYYQPYLQERIRMRRKRERFLR